MLRSFNSKFAGVSIAGALTLLLSAQSVIAADAMPVSELQDRAAIQNLIVRYTIALDTLDADLYAGVFAEDAEFTFGGNTYSGRAEIRKIVTGLKERAAEPADDAAPKMYHALTNTYIELVNDHEARHRSYWQTITGPSSGPFNVGAMGVYEDVLVKHDGMWLIQNRKILQ
jgi:uncharacterized protein (TIGR02246 family)